MLVASMFLATLQTNKLIELLNNFPTHIYYFPIASNLFGNPTLRNIDISLPPHHYQKSPP